MIVFEVLIKLISVCFLSVEFSGHWIVYCFNVFDINRKFNNFMIWTGSCFIVYWPVRYFCKIDNKRVNISFFDVFYVSKCFLNLINFDQLNEIDYLMTYKSKLFMIENQDIITKKRVNNVFFFELWKHVNYNFIVTFIVDNSIKQFVKLSFTINNKILNDMTLD